MAGGAGTRFWPLSTEERPKQFLDILGTGKTFIQMTVDRFVGILPLENIYIITHEKYKNIIREQLPLIPDTQIIYEPSRNNTAPCILLAALKIRKLDPDACCLFVPADHLIIDRAAFQKNVMTALTYASTHQAIVTIGIVPSRPETGYGYIRLKESTNNEIKEVVQFVEKPDIDTAKLYVASGKYLWNAGMFAWHVNTIVQQYLSLAPNVYDILMKGQVHYNTPHEASWLQQHYPTTENISVDFAIMEKSDCVFTMAASFDWSDLGIWSSIYEVSEKDEQANVFIAGSGSLEDNFNNLIILPTGKQVIIKGIKDMIIVDSGAALLIYPKSEEQHIKASHSLLMRTTHKTPPQS